MPPPPSAPAGPRLLDTHIPDRPEGVVLVLHGGAARGPRTPVRPQQLAVLRMIPVASAITRAGGGRLAVLRLLNTWRGWEPSHSPVDDLDWALRELAGRFGSSCPVALVGHSLGGRAALVGAGRSGVAGVVALNPWLDLDEQIDLRGARRVVILHGDRDAVARPDRSLRLAESAAASSPVTYVTVTGGRHAMLGRRDGFDRLAGACVASMLLGVAADPRLAAIAAGGSGLRI